MYSISQFAERLGISADTLRYYEKEGLLAPQRNASGYRVYSERDEIWFGFLKRLKDTGMPMAQIKRYAQLREAGDATLAERCAGWTSTGRAWRKNSASWRSIRRIWTIKSATMRHCCKSRMRQPETGISQFQAAFV